MLSVEFLRQHCYHQYYMDVSHGLKADLRPIKKIYNWGIKRLLGVRMSTSNDLCYLELGFPPLRARVTHRQRKIFQSLWSDRRHYTDDPWTHAVNLSLGAGTPTGRCIAYLIDTQI